MCKKVFIIRANDINWKNKHAGRMPSEMWRLRGLEDKNTRPKRIVANLSTASGVKPEVVNYEFVGESFCRGHVGIPCDVTVASRVRVGAHEVRLESFAL